MREDVTKHLYTYRVSVNRMSPALEPAIIPALDTKESVRVDLPWSTCAMTDMLRMLVGRSLVIVSNLQRVTKSANSRKGEATHIRPRISSIVKLRRQHTFLRLLQRSNSSPDTRHGSELQFPKNLPLLPPDRSCAPMHSRNGLCALVCS
jgi:hypothetical protein